MTTPWGAILGGVAGIADDLITTDEERRQLDLEAYKVDAGLVLAQIKVNEAAAVHPSTFVAGARPAVIWVGVLGLGWQFLVYPMLLWVWALMQAAGWIPATMPPPPLLDIEALLVLLGSTLGLSGLRSWDKGRNVDTKVIGP